MLAHLVEPGHVYSYGRGHPTLQAALWYKNAFNAALNTVDAVASCTVGSDAAGPGGMPSMRRRVEFKRGRSPGEVGAGRMP